MLNYNNVLKDELNHNGLSIREISPVMKLNLRGKKREFFTTVGKNLNMLLPTEANTSSVGDKLTSIWLSPDEWMIVSNETVQKDSGQLEGVVIEDRTVAWIGTHLGRARSYRWQVQLAKGEPVTVIGLVS